MRRLCPNLGTSNIFCQLSRFKSTSINDGSKLFQLRKRTGLAYSLCREALNKHDNDVDNAEAWLKTQALAHGLQKASKVSGRATREGLLCLNIQRDHKVATVVELSCETDFVARNQYFKDFTIDLTEQISSSEDNFGQGPNSGSNPVEELQLKDSMLKNTEHKIAPMITKFGESIKIARAYRVESKWHSDVSLFGQIHAKVGTKSTSQSDIVAGKYGAIVALKFDNSKNNETTSSYLAPFGNRLCQHVIGYNPSYIELPCDIRKHLEEAERERDVAISQGPVGAQNVDEDDFSDQENATNTSGNRHDDWPSIMDQTLIMSDEFTVRDFCAENNFSIVYFSRVECGAELENKMFNLRPIAKPSLFSDQRRSISYCRLSNKKITRIESDIELEDCEFKKRLINRNPRNLELLSYQHKPEGFWLDKTPPSDWNRLVFEEDGKHLVAYLEHWSGKRLVQVSTREPKLVKYFKSTKTIQAAYLLGQFISRRCLQSGYACAGMDDIDEELRGVKAKAFVEAVIANGFLLNEAPEIKPRTVVDL